MKKLLAALLLLPAIAFGQSVQQSGTITPGHAVQWITNGIIGDGGVPGGPIFTGSTTVNDFACVGMSGTIIDCGLSATSTNNWPAQQNFNGGATAPTRSPGDITTNVATTAFVAAAISAAPFPSLCTISGAFPIYNSTSASWVCSTAGGVGSVATIGGGPLTITPTAGTNATGLVINQAPAGTVTSRTVSSFNVFGFNSLNISGDTTTNVASGANTSGLLIDYSFGSSGSVGGHIGTDVFALLNAPTSASNAQRFYVGGRFVSEANSGDGGTDTNAGSLGAMVGINPFGVLNTGATNFNAVSAMEANVYVDATASVKYKQGISIVQSTGDGTQGAIYDCAICLSNQASVNWKNLFLVGNMNGQFPLTSGGSILSTTGGGTTTNGFDLTGLTFSGVMFKGQANGAGAFAQLLNGAGNATLYQVDNSGNVFSKQFQVGGATSGITTLAAASTASGVLSLPSTTDTLVAKATTDTLTNKTYDTGGTGNVFKLNGTNAGTVAQMQAALGYPFIIGGSATGVNLNSANTDTTITITSPTANYRINQILLTNTGTTASLTTATAGLFSAAAGGGTVVAANQALSGITSNTVDVAINQFGLVVANNAYSNFSQLFFRVGTAQGASATGNVYVVIQPLP